MSKPSILAIGTVVPEGASLRVTGWHLGACLANCRCHRHPAAAGLHLLTGDGLLGLVCFVPDGCTCCEPWTTVELRKILLDLADFATLEEAPGWNPPR